MAEYRVVYEDTVEAESLVEAALKLEQILRNGIDFRPTILVEEVDTGGIDTFDLDEDGAPPPLDDYPEMVGLIAIGPDGEETLLGQMEFESDVSPEERHGVLMDEFWDARLDSAGCLSASRRLSVID